MHVCKICNESDITKFRIRSDNKKPYNFCKNCRNDRYKENHLSYYKSEKGKEVKRNSDKKYYASNKETLLERNKSYREANKDILSFKKSEYYKANKFLILEKCKEYKKSNKAIVNTYCSKRRAAKLNATPNWGELNDLIIKEAYDLARLRSDLTGIEYHVDHIIPLKNSEVCGLHVGINLQVIPKEENLKKSNKLLKI